MKWSEEDDFWAELESGDETVPNVSPPKSRSLISTTAASKKNTLTTHPLHSVFPRDSKAGKAIAWWAAGVYTFRSGKKVYDWLEERAEEARKEKFTINIESYEEEDLYNIVFGWIISETDFDSNDITDFNLVTIYKRPKNVVFRTSSTANSFCLNLCGHDVQIGLDEQEKKDGTVTSFKRSLVIRCKDQTAVDEISQVITDRYDEFMYAKAKDEVDAGRAPRPYASWTGMGWNWKELLPRDSESVILHAGDKETLFADIDKFRSLRVEYLRTNIPWHRGYLFHGPPGTGKTSLGMAVASVYDMPIYFLSLTSVASDADLIKAVNAIDAKEAVLIIEDIDVVKATHSRTANNSAEASSKVLTLNGLLNVLDGVNSPSGLITVMTTNFITTLDPALVRPGRVDMQLEIGFLDNDQLRRLILWYIGVEVNDFPTIKSEITPADITGIVKNTMGDPDACISQVREYVNNRNRRNTRGKALTDGKKSE